MKKADVKINGVYRSYVSGILVNVRVTGTQLNSSKRTVFTVVRDDNGKPLQPRSPAALRA